MSCNPCNSSSNVPVPVKETNLAEKDASHKPRSLTEKAVNVLGRIGNAVFGAGMGFLGGVAILHWERIGACWPTEVQSATPSLCKSISYMSDSQIIMALTTGTVVGAGLAATQRPSCCKKMTVCAAVTALVAVGAMLTGYIAFVEQFE
jgi:hypothetical protein